jgi:hypothetical protein
MTQITANGRTYSDDGSSPRDMRNGGYATFLLQMLSDMMAQTGVDASTATSKALQAAASAALAQSLAASLQGTSASAVTMGAGAKAFATQAGKFFSVGTFLRVQRSSNVDVYMYGRVTAYDSVTGALTLNVERVEGSGSYSDWAFFVTARAGDVGPAGSPAISARDISSPDTVLATDVFKLLRLAGTFTLSFTAVGTLGPAFSVFLKNTGTGLITLDPAASELIDGQATRPLHPGQTALVTCDGTKLTMLLLDPGTGGFLHFQDRRASGVQADNGVIGGFVTRVINTIVANTLAGASIASNQITLEPGTYEVSINLCRGNYGSQAFLENVTDGAYSLLGMSSYQHSSTITGRITITSTKVFRIRHFISSGAGSAGMGNAVSSGQSELYLDGIIWRVA